MNSQSLITAIGTYVPDQILSNNDLERKGREGKLNNGDTLLLYGFGDGFSHLGLIVERDLN